MGWFHPQQAPGLRRVHFIINGEDVWLSFVEGDDLRLLRNEALWLSHNRGRPFDDWHVRDDRGHLVDVGRPAADFGGVRGRSQPLFLTLRVGVGGCYPSRVTLSV